MSRRPALIVGLVWLGMMAGVALSSHACRRGVPVIDPSPPPAGSRGTISGNVRGPDGSPVSARTVEAENVETGVRVAVRTSVTGGFTLLVPPGRYRLSVELQPGESALERPDELTVEASELERDADFVIATVVRPRHDRLRPTVDHRLGSPIA